MFGFGTPELLVIGAIVMLVFGVGKLPEVGGSVGKAINNFRKAADNKDHAEQNTPIGNKPENAA